MAVLFLTSFVLGCDNGQIDINSASAEELENLIGIGPVYAGRIIQGRTYEVMDDLLDLVGIGEKTLEKIKQQGLACINEEETKEDENIERVDEENNVIAEIKDERTYAPQAEIGSIINLNHQQSSTDKVIYESKNQKIKNYAIYGFSLFLVLVILVLLMRK